MNQEPLQRPTASELEILRVLWERGPSTVRDVYEALREKKDLGYTTVLKLLQIMTVKGTVRRNEEQRAHVYEACQPATETKRQLVGDVLQRVFKGSASELMIHARERGVLFAPGRYFYVQSPMPNTLRLGFASLNEKELARGVATLAELLKSEMRKRQRGTRRAERAHVALV